MHDHLFRKTICTHKQPNNVQKLICIFSRPKILVMIIHQRMIWSPTSILTLKSIPIPTMKPNMKPIFYWTPTLTLSTLPNPTINIMALPLTQKVALLSLVTLFHQDLRIIHSVMASHFHLTSPLTHQQVIPGPPLIPLISQLIRNRPKLFEINFEFYYFFFLKIIFSKHNSG